MARKIDPTVEAILKDFRLSPQEALWDCHGTWVMYHRFIERIAADQGIAFDPPMVLEANSASKCVAICVTGRFKDRAEWSIGEAAPGNCKNAYPYAMAEKRAKDRVVLKLIGLHGLVYSDEEMDGNGEQPKAAPAPAPEPPKASPADADRSRVRADKLIAELRKTESVADHEHWGNNANVDDLTEADRARVRTSWLLRLNDLKAKEAA